LYSQCLCGEFSVWVAAEGRAMVLSAFNGILRSLSRNSGGGSPEGTSGVQYTGPVTALAVMDRLDRL
ncbi:hypothetical protein ACFL2Q_16430, partial [Thermodesulfobacteriota bacterium]